MGKAERGGRGTGGEMVIQQVRTRSGALGPQKRKARTVGLTKGRRKRFLAELAESANVTEAARIAGVGKSTVYRMRASDPTLAEQWDEALDQGYAELEAMLLHRCLFGSERVEIVEDGEGAVKSRKRVREIPMGVAIRLLTLHAAKVERRRAARGAEQPDGAGSVERLRQAMALIRARSGRTEGGESSA
jgi:hypothetical protein